MTDPIHPWLDADELRQLAESLMQNDRRPKQAPDTDAAFGDNFVGFAGEPSVAPVASVQPPVMEVPAPPAPPLPPMITAPKPVAIPVPAAVSPSPAPLAPSPAPLAPSPVAAPPVTPTPLVGAEAQCQQFEERMNREFGAGRIFILNRDGHTVFGKEHHAHLQFIARSLTRDADRRGLPKGHIHIKVGPAQVLEIIPVDLPNGGWVIGTVVSQPLQPAQIQLWVREISKLSSSLNQL